MNFTEPPNEVQKTIDESVLLDRNASKEQIIKEIPSLAALNEDELMSYLDRFRQLSLIQDIEKKFGVKGYMPGRSSKTPDFFSNRG